MSLGSLRHTFPPATTRRTAQVFTEPDNTFEESNTKERLHSFNLSRSDTDSSTKVEVGDEVPGLDHDRDGRANDSGAWSLLADKLKAYDENIVKDWKEEIDTLLVFAGLFSAVLTAFNIEWYKLLQANSGDQSVLLLAQITSQLAGFSFHSLPLNSTQPGIPKLPSFRPQPSAVRINTLWFASLICSLVSASLAILVKQWLREYFAGLHTSPRKCIRVRQFRYEGLVQWCVPEIVSLLPLLLQLALLLFMVGLLDLLWSLHPLVASVSTALVAVWIMFYIATTLLPSLYHNCPYKSPQARGFFPLFRPLKELGLAVHRRTGMTRSTRLLRSRPSVLRFYARWLSWCGTVRWHDREYDAQTNSSVEIRALVAADTMFLDNDFLETTLRQCLRSIDGGDRVRCIQLLLARRFGFPVEELPRFELPVVDGASPLTFVHITLDAVSRLVRHLDDYRGLKFWEDWMDAVLDFLPAVYNTSRLHSWLSIKQPGAGVADAAARSGVLTAVNMLVNFVLKKREDTRSLSSHDRQHMNQRAFEHLIYLSPKIEEYSLAPVVESGKDAISRIVSYAATYAERCGNDSDRTPLDVCRVVLALACHIHDDYLQENQSAIHDLLMTLASETEWNKVNRNVYHLSLEKDELECLALADRLNSRVPGLVEGAVLSDVCRMAWKQCGAQK